MILKSVFPKAILAFAVIQISCGNLAPLKDPELPFVSVPVSVKVNPGMIDEASGIAQSRTGTDFFWVEQDSGNSPDIYRLGKDGNLISKVALKGLENRDWEDLVISKGPKPGANYLYLAETGDNLSLHNNYVIYRFEEPADKADAVSLFEAIRFRYPDKAHDAEAILVDHESHDIYVITKRDAKSQIYKLKYPQDTVNENTPELMGEMPFTGVVSATLSSDSKEIILKTYTKLFYWAKPATEKIESALKKPYINLGYQPEPQGEGICFSGDGSGFFTLGEKPFLSSAVNLNFYKRK